MQLVHRFSSPGLLDSARSHDAPDGVLLNKMTGTPAFMAPEVFARSFGRPSDMWSLGMLAYQALSDRCPPPTHSLRFHLPRNPGATTCLPECAVRMYRITAV